MNVKLTVVQGKPEGKEFNLPVSPFLIGRGKECHLRPNNEVIGERHCAIVAEGDTVRVQDLGSANGTFVNGQRIDGEVTVHSGDLLQVGPLVFAFTLASPGTKMPAVVSSASQSASGRRSASSSFTSGPPDEQQEGEDVDVTDWLAGGQSQAVSSASAETESRPATTTVLDAAEPPDGSADAVGEQPKKEDKPVIPTSQSTSRAASDILRKYFERPRG